MNEIQLVITMNAQSQIQVAGPIENRGLCYMLLELAKDAVRSHAEKPQGGLLVAQGAIPNGLGGR